MPLGQTVLLGVIAGATIVLGLPVGRLRAAAPRARVVLNATAIGVLLFLFWDVLSAAWEPIDSGLSDLHAGNGGAATVLGYGVVLAFGLTVSLLGLALYEKWMSSPARTGYRTAADADRRAGGAAPFGPGAMSQAEALSIAGGIHAWPQALRTALLISVGIGLHNFAEGLAIGQSAAAGQIGLATTLVIGFGLHNATEGFGIVAPLAAQDNPTRPSWGLLGVFALIGGGPTFIGTVVGHGFTNQVVSVAFLSLAAGSILYVVAQLLQVAGKARRNDLLAAGLLIGLFAGFATDAIVTLAGV